MDENFINGGFGDWCLEFVFCHSNVFRLLAVLHDAAGAVRSEFGESPGYC